LTFLGEKKNLPERANFGVYRANFGVYRANFGVYRAKIAL
jgi:hypothetical protein